MGKRFERVQNQKLILSINRLFHIRNKCEEKKKKKSSSSRFLFSLALFDVAASERSFSRILGESEGQFHFSQQTGHKERSGEGLYKA